MVEEIKQINKTEEKPGQPKRLRICQELAKMLGHTFFGLEWDGATPTVKTESAPQGAGVGSD